VSHFEILHGGHKIFFGPHILQSKVEKVTKQMRSKKATGDDAVSGDVFN
jgi:hypothetical protein